MKWLTISAMLISVLAMLGAIFVEVDLKVVVALIGTAIVNAILALAHESGLKS